MPPHILQYNSANTTQRAHKYNGCQHIIICIQAVNKVWLVKVEVQDKSIAHHGSGQGLGKSGTGMKHAVRSRKRQENRGV